MDACTILVVFRNTAPLKSKTKVTQRQTQICFVSLFPQTTGRRCRAGTSSWLMSCTQSRAASGRECVTDEDSVIKSCDYGTQHETLFKPGYCGGPPIRCQTGVGVSRGRLQYNDPIQLPGQLDCSYSHLHLCSTFFYDSKWQLDLSLGRC